MNKYSLVRKLGGYSIIKIWRGYSSVIFIELEKIDQSSADEAIIMVESRWEVRNEQGLLVNSNSSFPEIDTIINTFSSVKISSIEFHGAEMELVLANDKTIKLVAESKKTWSIKFTKNDIWIVAYPDRENNQLTIHLKVDVALIEAPFEESQ